AEVRSLVYEGYEIHDLRASYKGSTSGHEAEASFGAAGARARVSAVLGGDLFVKNFAAELSGLNLAVLDPELPQTALQAQLSVRGPLQAVAGTLALVNPHPGPLDRERLPFARIDAAIATDFKVLTVHGVKAQLHPRGTLQGKGSASVERQAFEVRVADLDLRGLYSSLRETRLSGPLALELTPGRQRVKGTLAQEGLSLAAEAERSGDDVEIRALHARAGESEATGSGSLHLGKPLRFSADLRLARFDPARFGDYPAGSINGSLQASGNLGGSGAARWQIADSTLLGQKFESRGSARLAGERVVEADAWAALGKNRATAKGSFGGASERLVWTLHVPDLAALDARFGGEIRAQGVAGGSWKQPHGTLSAQATQLRLTERLVFERASVEGSGGLAKHDGKIAARGSELDFTASVRGGWRSNAWHGEIVSLSNAGAYPLELKTPASIEAAAQRVALGRFEAELAGARATVESVRWQDGRLSSSGAIAALSAQWVLNTLRIDKVAGDLKIDGDWALSSTPKLNGRLALRRASGDLAYGDQPLELSRAALEARFADDAVTGTMELVARVASARIQGKAAGLTPDSTLAATAEVELAELRQLTEPLWTQARVSGRVSASLRAAGTLAKPVLGGTVRGDALGFDMPPWGIALRDGSLRAALEG